MCGIVGYVGSRGAVDLLLKGLGRLEYRGYDSAGVAFFRDGKLEIRKAEGKLANVEKLVGASDRAATIRCGIGHTRWATHGKPTTQNAHPHRVGHVVLVHNGIIENYQDIRDSIVQRGLKPASETDSELLGFLIRDEMDLGGKPLVEAVRTAFSKIEGACSVVVMSEKEPGKIIGVRNGAPLAVALDPQGGVIFASDAQPILEYQNEIVFLENGDVAVGTEKGVEIVTLASPKRVERPKLKLDWSPDTLDKQGYAHYMLKEIFEQPTALIDTLNGLLDRASAEPFPLAEQPGVSVLQGARELVLVACGTSWHAALLGKYWIERFARIPVQVELASEFRYRDPVLSPGTVVVGVSQSGETADTLAVIKELKSKKIPTLVITNVRGSTLAREADGVFYTSAGPEIGVAATKTFSAQLFTLLLWAGSLARKAGSKSDLQSLFNGVLRLPHLIKTDLDPQGELIARIRATAKKTIASKGFFFIGRGFSFPLALEGALKLKEIAYVHAEGYAAGELKHGPIAMIDSKMTVVVIAPRDGWREKTVSNLEEVKARGAQIIGIGDSGDAALERLCDHWIPLKQESGQSLDPSLMPFRVAPVLQLLSYELALLAGTDVDKPRNLAKSVTVE